MKQGDAVVTRDHADPPVGAKRGLVVAKRNGTVTVEWIVPDPIGVVRFVRRSYHESELLPYQEDQGEE